MYIASISCYQQLKAAASFAGISESAAILGNVSYTAQNQWNFIKNHVFE